MKPVCYLDIDDTIIRWTKDTPEGRAAPYATEFMRFLMRHFEVRWLTMWCPDGTMCTERLGWLESFLGIPRSEFEHIRNPKRFSVKANGVFKTDGINWQEVGEGRGFVWIEDSLTKTDQRRLDAKGHLDCHIPCDVTKNPDRLKEVEEELIRRFVLNPQAENQA